MRKTTIKPKQNQPKVSSLETMDIVHPHAAAADIGSREIWVSLPPDRMGETVRCFGTFTPDLESLVQWLLENRVDTVAMEYIALASGHVLNVLGLDQVSLNLIGFQ